MKKNNNKIILSIVAFTALHFISKTICMDRMIFCYDSSGIEGSAGFWVQSPTDYFDRIFARIEECNIEKIKRFVEKYGNNPKIINVISQNKSWHRTKMTPLSFALDKNIKNEEPALLLMDAKAVDINRKDSDGSTPLYLACRHGWLKSIEKLLKLGANLHEKYDHKQTLLFNVTDIKIAKLLIENGARINALDYNGDTVLHFCLRCNREDKFYLFLILNGATVDYKACIIAETINKPVLLKHLTIIKKYNNFLGNKIKFIKKQADLENNFFEFLIKFIFCKSVKEFQDSHNREIEQNNACRSFETTDFYKYYTESKNKQNIAQIFSVFNNNQKNIYEFVKEAAEKAEEKHNFCFNRKLLEKNIVGSKMLENKKYRDCKVECE